MDAQNVVDQIHGFEDALRTVKENGLAPAVCHMDNTGGIFAHPETWKNMVRPGLALYGYALPLVKAGQSELPAVAAQLEPVLSWRTRIISMKEMGRPTVRIRRIIRNEENIADCGFARGLRGRL